MTLFNPTGKVETSGTPAGIAGREQSGTGECKTRKASPEEIDAMIKEMGEKKLSPKEKTIVDIIVNSPEPLTLKEVVEKEKASLYYVRQVAKRNGLWDRLNVKQHYSGKPKAKLDDPKATMTVDQLEELLGRGDVECYAEAPTSDETAEKDTESVEDVEKPVPDTVEEAPEQETETVEAVPESADAAPIEPVPEPVDHPEYYNQGIEAIDYIESHNLNFNRGNVVKYLTRAGLKDSEIEDLEKALWYLNREIQRVKRTKK